MKTKREQWTVQKYIAAFFPADYSVSLSQSDIAQNYRILSVTKSLTNSTAQHEGPLHNILDACFLSELAPKLIKQTKNGTKPEQNVGLQLARSQNNSSAIE
ncbi:MULTISPECIES: hypothetical protein [unclassified Pseudomonas]|uniref:hypothetical protein n=1 Tax=unclassified Pseudomonas TaxID=196821 RepID=UPI00131CFB43|nr:MULTISPECIES: hypothetical protein [unclassified Pseudomonas]